MLTTYQYWPKNKPIPSGWVKTGKMEDSHHGEWSIIIMETKEIIKDVYMHPSVGGVIISRESRKWAKWVLRKLIPSEMWESPPIDVCKLEAGTYIGKVTFHACELDTCCEPTMLDIGDNYGG